MEVGEKYLSISFMGKKELTFAAFPNEKKQKPTDPDFIGNGLAVWVNKKKAEVKEEKIL